MSSPCDDSCPVCNWSSMKRLTPADHRVSEPCAPQQHLLGSRKHKQAEQAPGVSRHDARSRVRFPAGAMSSLHHDPTPENEEDQISTSGDRFPGGTLPRFYRARSNLRAPSKQCRPSPQVAGMETLSCLCRASCPRQKSRQAPPRVRDMPSPLCPASSRRLAGGIGHRHPILSFVLVV